MRDLELLVPGSLDTLTGGYLYDCRIRDGLRQRGWHVEVRELDGSFPSPTVEALKHAAAVFAAITDGSLVVVDSLAFGAMPDVIEREASRLRIVALVHLPLAAEIGLDASTVNRVKAAERRALASAALVVVTGASSVPLLMDYDVARERIVVVEPGTDRAPLARGSSGPVLQLLSVATLNPGKGHEVLFRALSGVATPRWRLTCVGSTTRHPQTTERLRHLLRMLEMDDRVTLAGELDRSALARCYDTADLFVHATLRETFGMAVAEALARGIPVVSTTTGAIPELVGDKAGVLVPPGDAVALADALNLAILNTGLRAQLAIGARDVRDRLPTWEEAIIGMEAALEQVAAVG